MITLKFHSFEESTKEKERIHLHSSFIYISFFLCSTFLIFAQFAVQSEFESKEKITFALALVCLILQQEPKYTTVALYNCCWLELERMTVKNRSKIESISFT